MTVFRVVLTPAESSLRERERQRGQESGWGSWGDRSSKNPLLDKHAALKTTQKYQAGWYGQHKRKKRVKTSLGVIDNFHKKIYL